MMRNDFMSSEESGEEDSIIIHRLPWRSRYVDAMFTKIDVYSMYKKSSQARRQMKARKVSDDPSTRPVPDQVHELPEWSIQ